MRRFGLCRRLTLFRSSTRLSAMNEPVSVAATQPAPPHGAFTLRLLAAIIDLFALAVRLAVFISFLFVAMCTSAALRQVRTATTV